MLSAIDHQLAPGGVVVFGELHGTMEVPAFVAMVADVAATRGPVTIALEIPDDVQPGVDAFLAAPDDELGLAALIASPAPFWQYRDGRGGEGLALLLSRLRALRASGRDVAVACIDGSRETAEERDAGMGANVNAAIARRPGATTLVVCGNLHARADSPRWMAWHVRDRHPDAIVLDLGHDGGSAFVASGPDRQGIEPMAPRWPGPPGVTLFAQRHEWGWDGSYHVGTLTPSLPLVES